MRYLVLAVVLVLGVVVISHAQSKSAPAKHEPNGGFVADADAAKEVAKETMRRLLSPDDFRRKILSEAALTNGVWTVRYWEPKVRLNSPLVIKIRQRSGAIIMYGDPNA
jgi:hypothetical protein